MSALCFILPYPESILFPGEIYIYLLFDGVSSCNMSHAGHISCEDVWHTA
jgi:hypothetical protein